MPAAHADLLDRLRHQPGMEDAAKVRIVPVSGIVLEQRIDRRRCRTPGERELQLRSATAISGRWARRCSRAATSTSETPPPRQEWRSSPNRSRACSSADRIRRADVSDRRAAGHAAARLRDRRLGERLEVQRSARAVRAAGVRARRSGRAARVPRSVWWFAPRPPLDTSDVGDDGARPEINPSIVVEFRTMQSQVRDSLLRERLMATLSGFFGAPGGADRDDRPLRRDVVHGGAPPQRNRHPHGARRRSARGRPHGDARSGRLFAAGVLVGAGGAAWPRARPARSSSA